MSKTQKKSYFPSAFLVIISIMVFFIIASWIGRAITNDIEGIGILDVFTSIWRGFSSKVDVILFIFGIGGTLGVMTKIQAIDAGISRLVEKLGDKVWLLIPVLMLVFGLGGTSYGMWEETIGFIPILIPVFRKAGYGSFTAILVILVGAGTGCLASTINPFAVGAAVDGANKVEILASTKTDAAKTIGSEFNFSTGTMQGVRWLSFVIFEIISITLVTWLSIRYKKANEAKYQTNALAKQANKSFIAKWFTGPIVIEGIDKELINKRFKESTNVEFTWRRKVSLILFVITFLLMIIMYLPWADWLNLTAGIEGYNKSMWWFASTSSAGFAKIGDWYFISVGALFLLFTIIVFALNVNEFKGEKDNVETTFISTYMDGVKDVVSVCMIIATAAGLGNILQATKFDVLIAEKSASGLKNWISFGVVIFIISIFLSFLMPSTSGFAAAFIPIFARIATLAFPGREATGIALAMLGFLFANGIVNLVSPTSAALMGYTAYAGVPYNVWIKQVWKIVVILLVVSFALILVFSFAASQGNDLF